MPSDRIELDVGGTKFATSASVLTANSAYFATKLPDHDGNEPLFLAQDPAAFRTLLGYMCRGKIKLDEIDEYVLLLAEFLGVEKFVLAAKIHWYKNIGRGPVLYDDDDTTDEEIAAAFDQVHGGISKAITTGLFNLFLKQDDDTAERDYAILSVTHGGEWTFEVHEVGKAQLSSTIVCGGLIGAINGLYAKGYNYHEEQTDHNSVGNVYTQTFTFSRLRHSFVPIRAADGIFIPAGATLGHPNCVKQFALVVNVDWDNESVVAPAEFNDDSHLFAEARVPDDDANSFWQEKNGFMKREHWVETTFSMYISDAFKDAKRVRALRAPACVQGSKIGRKRKHAST